MFPLKTAALPSSGSDLERLLNESLQRFFITEFEPVTVRENSYPQLEAISISLDGARLRPDPPHRPVVEREAAPALEVDQFAIRGAPLFLGPAVINLSLSAQEVRLDRRKDPNGQIVLTVRNAAEGSIEISTTPTDLEALTAKLAEVQAAGRGVTIDRVQLKLRQQNPRSLAAEVRLRVRKSFLSASIQATGQLELDDQLNLAISDLNCSGDGAFATLACGLLKPYLEEINGRKFSLMSLSLGEIRLRDVQVTVGDKISVTAKFGGSPETPIR